MSGANGFNFSLPKRFSALVLSLLLGIFWILFPASWAAASALSPSAPLKTEVRPRVVAEVLEVSPRVWRQGQDANVTLTLQLANNSPSFIRKPRLEIDLTKQPLPESSQWKQWLSGKKITGIDATQSSAENLMHVQLPSMFAYSRATVKVNLPAQRIQELTQTAGIYGLKSSLSVVALSNISVSANQTRLQVNQFLKPDTDNKTAPPPELGVKNESFSFHPQFPLDTRVHSDSKYVGDTYRSNSFTLLPVFSNQKSEVPVTLFTDLGLVPSDLNEQIPAVAAAERNQALIAAAKQADVSLLVDPAALDYLPKLMPAPKDIHNFTGWTVDQIIDPVKNSNDDTTDPDRSQSSSKQSVAEPKTVEEPTTGVYTPEPGPEHSADMANRMQVLQVAHSLSQLKPENLAFLPWGAPDLSSVMKPKIVAQTLTSGALAQQSDWAELFQQVQQATAGKNHPQAPLQLVKLNDFKVFSDPLKELPQVLEAGGAQRHLLLTNHQVQSQTVGSTGIFSDLPAGSASAAVENVDASEALQTAVSAAKNAGINPSQLFLANLVSHAINGQSLMVRIPSDPAAISGSKTFLTHLMEEQDWVKTQNLHQLLSEPERNQLRLQTTNQRSEKINQNDLTRSYQLLSEKLKKLSGVAAILDAPENLLNPAVDTSILQLRQDSPSESKILEWAGSLEPWWQPLSVNPPENVLMIYGESTLPVSVQNPLPWPVTVNLEADTDSPRLQSRQPSKAKISGNSSGSVDLKLNGVGSGDIRTEVKLVSTAQAQVSPAESLVVRVRANWETRGLFLVGGIAAAVFIFGLVRRIRQGRRTQSLSLENAKQFHNA